jgi:hypothetical protein
MNRNRLCFWLDVILAIWLVVAFTSSSVGAWLHAAIGAALGLGVAIHLILHWKWIMAVSKSRLKTLPGAVRFKLMLNVLSLLAFALTITSGLIMLPAFSDPVASAGAVPQYSGLDPVVRGDGFFQRHAGRGLMGHALRRGEPDFHWHAIHHASAILVLLTVTLHLALNRKWLVSNARRCLGIESDEKQSQLEAKEGA